MTTAHRVIRFASLLLAAAVVGCSDDDRLGDPSTPNIVDTVTIGSLVGTPITTPSGFSVLGGAIRTDRTAEFDFAYNIDAGQHVFVPRAVLGIVSSTANPGLQRQEAEFDAIEVARSNGYVTEESVPVAVGERYVVRSRVVCSALGVPLYAKIEVIGFEDNLVHLKVLANTNCGYKGLQPGLPDR